jgi:SAM-dependent methyltransferase
LKVAQEFLEYASKYWNKEVVREEIEREEKFPLVDVQTTIAWLKIRNYLNSEQVANILDAGAGFGRYSIPLAKFGYKVTHLDISGDMLELAKEFADKDDIENISFTQGSIIEMDDFDDKSFDLTISFDAPVSYCYPKHKEAIQELCRVTDKYLMLMVSSRSGVLPFMIDFDLDRNYIPPGYIKKIDPFHVTKTILAKGVEEWPPAIKRYLEDTGKDAPLDYSFTVEELTEILEQNNFEIAEIGGPGALARSIKAENLEKIRSDERLFNEFIKFSLDFDFDKHNLGLGAVNLFVIAKRKA